jgi:hypothetical protein
MVRNILPICLMPHCAYLSQTSRMIEIHRALQARGVPARVATYGGTYESALRAAGIDYDVIGPPMDAGRCARFLREQPSSGPVGQSAYSDEELRAYVRAKAGYFTRHRIGTVVTGFALTRRPGSKQRENNGKHDLRCSRRVVKPYMPRGTMSDEELAAENISELRWWTLRDLTDYRGPDRFGPRDLATQLVALVTHGVPATPIPIGL